MCENNIEKCVNLFESLDQCSEIDFALMIAYMRSNTIGGQIKDKIQNVGTKIAKFFGKERPQFLEYETVADKQRKELRDLLEHHSREELLVILKEELFDYVNVKNNNIQTLSDEIIRQAAEGHKDIPEQLSLDQVADSIYNLTNIAFTKQLSEITPEQEQEMDEMIEKDLALLSPEKRLALQKTLGTQDITAQAIRQAAKSTGLSLAMMGIGSSFGGYIFLSMIIHAIGVSILHITIPFAVYSFGSSVLSVVTGPIGFLGLAGYSGYQCYNINKNWNSIVLSLIVYYAVLARGKSYTVDQNGEPLWFTSDATEYKLYKEQESIIATLRTKVNNLNVEFVELQEKESRNKKRLAEIEPRLAEVKVELEIKESRIKELEKSKNSIDVKEFKNLKAERQSLKRKLAGVQSERDAAKQLLTETQEQMRKKDDARTALQKQADKLKEKNKELLATNVELRKSMEDRDKDEKEALRVFGVNKLNIYNDEVRQAVESGIKNAQEEIAFKTPFMSEDVLTDRVHNRDSLMTLMAQALKRGVVIKIYYGLNTGSNPNSNKPKNASKAIARIKKDFAIYLGSQLRIVKGNDHSKVMIVDGKYLLSGSYNFFSNPGIFTSGGGEKMAISANPQRVELDYNKYFDFDTLTIRQPDKVTYDESL